MLERISICKCRKSTSRSLAYHNNLATRPCINNPATIPGPSTRGTLPVQLNLSAHTMV